MTGYESKRAAAQDKLAQPAQEPVAWMHVMDNTEGLKVNGTGVVSITKRRKHPFGKAGVDFSKSYPVISTPLYTTPPQRTWVGLTDDEVGNLSDFAYANDEEFVRNVEKHLKEKNSG